MYYFNNGLRLKLTTGLILIMIFECAIITYLWSSVSFAQALGGLFVFICLLPWILAFSEKRLDPGEPIYYFTAYLAVSIGIRGLIILSSGSYIISPIFLIGTSEFDDLVVHAFVISIIGLLAFLAGYYIKWGDNLGKKIPILKCFWSTRNILYALTLATIVGLIGLFLFLNSMGGGFIDAINMLNEISTQQSGIQYYYFPLMWFLVVCLLIF